MIIGVLFGIHRMCIWLLPKKIDIGETVGVWTVNIMLRCLIGEVIVIWHILYAVCVLTEYFVDAFKK